MLHPTSYQHAHLPFVLDSSTSTMKIPVAITIAALVASTSADDIPSCAYSILRPFLLDQAFSECSTATGYVFKSLPALTDASLKLLCDTPICRVALEPFVWQEYDECVAPVGTKTTLFLAQFVSPIRQTCFKGVPPTPVPTTPEPTGTLTPVTETPAPTTARPSC